MRQAELMIADPARFIGTEWSSADNSYRIVRHTDDRCGLRFMVERIAPEGAWDRGLLYSFIPEAFDSFDLRRAPAQGHLGDLADDEAQVRYGSYERNRSGND